MAVAAGDKSAFTFWFEPLTLNDNLAVQANENFTFHICPRRRVLTPVADSLVLGMDACSQAGGVTLQVAPQSPKPFAVSQFFARRHHHRRRRHYL